MPPNFRAAVVSSKQDPIKDELKIICGRLIVDELWTVLKKRVKRTRKINEAEVADIVMLASKGIGELDQPDIYHGRNLDSFEKARDYLKEALVRLRALEKRTQNKIERDIREEEEAIRVDQEIFDAKKREAEPLRALPSRVIQFIEINASIDAPTTPIHQADLRYETYAGLMEYLVEANVAKSPELWIKRESAYQMPDQWEYWNGTRRIESNEIFVLSTQGRIDYIVVAVHERDIGKPVVLDLPRFGGESACCPSQCGNLGKHLKNIWPQHLVERAHYFSNPENHEVLLTAFDTRLFETRTNPLYVYCKRREP